MNLKEIIADIIYDHLKGKHKDNLSSKLADQIIEAMAGYYEGLSDFPEDIDSKNPASPIQ
jgi:acyl carrier protein phosphodiesterase